METMIGLVVTKALKTFRKSFWKFGDVRDVYVEHLKFQDLFCRCPSRFWSTNTTSRLKDKVIKPIWLIPRQNLQTTMPESGRGDLGLEDVMVMPTLTINGFPIIERFH